MSKEEKEKRLGLEGELSYQKRKMKKRGKKEKKIPEFRGLCSCKKRITKMG